MGEADERGDVERRGLEREGFSGREREGFDGGEGGSRMEPGS